MRPSARLTSSMSGRCAFSQRCAAWALMTVSSDRLVHFVGDRGGELAHRGDAVRVRQLCLHLAQRLTHPLTICDILTHNQGDGSVLDQHDLGRLSNPEDLAILANLARLPARGLAASFEADGCVPFDGLPVLRVKEVPHGKPDQFLDREAELLGAERIHRHDGAGHIDHEVHRRIVFENRLPLLLAFPQRCLGSLAFGNIAPDPAIAGEAPCLIERRQPRDGNITLVAIWRRPRELEIAKREVGVERLPVCAPSLRVRLHVWHFPARLSDLRPRRRRFRKAFSVLLAGEAMLCVGLPVHVEGELHEGAKALLALAQRLFRPPALGYIDRGADEFD